MKQLWRDLKRAVGNCWYWFRCNTYNRYHMIDCRAPLNGYSWGYQDPSEMLLYANFAILVDFVEKDIVFDRIPHRKIKNKYYVYHWDGALKPDPSILELPTPELAAEWHEIALDNHRTGQEIKELYLWWTVLRADQHENRYDSEALDVKDQEMLTRLIAIRRSLWV